MTDARIFLNFESSHHYLALKAVFFRGFEKVTGLTAI